MTLKKALLLSFILLAFFSSRAQNTHTFTLADSAFMLDGKPFQMISGEMHYPRIPREAWRARMKMAKAMGLNTIGTYVFWNVQEPQKGKFDFTGNNDVAEFVKIAKEEGLWVILRPSPYVCAEWEFGGYPYWLQNEKGLVVRSKEAKYLEQYKTYIKEIGRQLAPLQVNHGGNILMVQIENEYGSYSNDKDYLAINRQMFKEAGFDGLLYTCDPPAAIVDGHLPGLLPAINGIDDPVKVKKMINDNHNGKGPYYIAEWYPAWFDCWGTKHHTVPAENYTGKLDAVLSAGISINMYMFHGGTTRGFMNGANFDDQHPYEAGNATHKFMLFRDVIAKHLPAGQSLPPVPPAKPVIAINNIQLNQSDGILDILPKSVINKTPLTFEDLNQDYGFVLYQTTILGGRTGLLKLNGLRDYAVIMINGKTVGTVDRRKYQDSIRLNLPKGKVKLDILVENLGRINFGPYLLKNKKGITENVMFDNKQVYNWAMYSLPFNNVSKVSYNLTKAIKPTTPVVRKGTFELTKPADTYLDMSHWGKGVVWVNGHNLGRYWKVGPQQTIYLPAEWLKKGKNEVVIFELLNSDVKTLSSLEKPILDKLN
jgi:beta-galactosidase